MMLAKISVKHKILITFMSIILNICFGCSKELSQLDGSFEYQLVMFGLRNTMIPIHRSR